MADMSSFDIDKVDLDGITVIDPAIGRAVISVAKSHGVYPGDMPEEDQALINVATEIIELAKRAVRAGAKGAAVNEVIFTASQIEDQAPAVPTQDEPVAGPNTVEDLIPGYDGLRVSEIVANMEDLSDQELQIVKDYESEEGERPKILNFQPSAPSEVVGSRIEEPGPGTTSLDPVPEQPEPVPPAGDEPWEGYDTDKIPEIIRKLEWVMANDAQNIKATLDKTMQYEAENKHRSRLMGKLGDIVNNGVAATPSPPSMDEDEPSRRDSTSALAPEVPPVPQVADDHDVVSTSPFESEPASEPAEDWGQQEVPAQQSDLSRTTVQGAFGATARSIAAVGTTNMPIPADIPERLEFPYDFTELSDVEVRTLQGKFNAAYAYAHVKASEHDGFANDARIVADGKVSEYMRANEAPSRMSVTEQQTRALAASPEAQEARQEQNEQKALADRFRTLASTYLTTCERLSREQTGRQSDHETVR